MTKSVTVLGTGLMGEGMARSLAREGLAVTVWNRSAEKARPLADEGITVAEDPAIAVAGADVVLTMLFDADSVALVMEEALPAVKRDAVWVQTSTVGVEGAVRLAELAARHEIGYVDAPVMGTRQPAAQGQLTVLAAGPEALRDTVSPVFDAIAAKVLWLGERPGDGQRLKLVANSWVLSITGATAQAIALADGLGVAPHAFLDLIAGGPLDSGYAQLKGKAMIAGDFTPAFPVSGAAKDSGLIAEAMRGNGVDDRVMRALHEEFRAVVESGHAEEDMAAVVRAFRSPS
jgi:3-hydroxyisobutyrate dehydrogenase